MQQPQITLNHIGVATDRLPELKKLFQLLGIAEGPVESVPEQGVDVHFQTLEGAAPHIEFLEVKDPEGTVAQFIKKRGPGIHHLSFEVATGGLDPLCMKLKQAGYRLTYDAPKKGAQGMRMNFIHPASASGVLIELMEKAA
jgi:methylmalonyl-CoA epimerase